MNLYWLYHGGNCIMDTWRQWHHEKRKLTSARDATHSRRTEPSYRHIGNMGIVEPQNDHHFNYLLYLL